MKMTTIFLSIGNAWLKFIFGAFFIIMLSLFKCHEPGQSGLEQSNTLSTMEEISIICVL